MEFFKKKKPIEPVLLPDGVGREVDSLLEQDDFVKAVKFVRDRTGLGMVAATNAVKARSDMRA